MICQDWYIYWINILKKITIDEWQKRIISFNRYFLKNHLADPAYVACTFKMYIPAGNPLSPLSFRCTFGFRPLPMPVWGMGQACNIWPRGFHSSAPIITSLSLRCAFGFHPLPISVQCMGNGAGVHTKLSRGFHSSAPARGTGPNTPAIKESHSYSRRSPVHLQLHRRHTYQTTVFTATTEPRHICIYKYDQFLGIIFVVYIVHICCLCCTYIV